MCPIVQTWEVVFTTILMEPRAVHPEMLGPLCCTGIKFRASHMQTYAHHCRSCPVSWRSFQVLDMSIVEMLEFVPKTVQQAESLQDSATCDHCLGLLRITHVHDHGCLSCSVAFVSASLSMAGRNKTRSESGAPESEVPASALCCSSCWSWRGPCLDGTDCGEFCPRSTAKLQTHPSSSLKLALGVW